jgi:hypothetical protein
MVIGFSPVTVLFSLKYGFKLPSTYSIMFEYRLCSKGKPCYNYESMGW